MLPKLALDIIFSSERSCLLFTCLEFLKYSSKEFRSLYTHRLSSIYMMLVVQFSMSLLALFGLFRAPLSATACILYHLSPLLSTPFANFFEVFWGLVVLSVYTSKAAPVCACCPAFSTVFDAFKPYQNRFCRLRTSTRSTFSKTFLSFFLQKRTLKTQPLSRLRFIFTILSYLAVASNKGWRYPSGKEYTSTVSPSRFNLILDE